MKFFLLYTLVCQHSSITDVLDFDSTKEMNEFLSRHRHSINEVQNQGPNTAYCSAWPVRVWQGKELNIKTVITR